MPALRMAIVLVSFLLLTGCAKVEVNFECSGLIIQRSELTKFLGEERIEPRRAMVDVTKDQFERLFRLHAGDSIRMARLTLVSGNAGTIEAGEEVLGLVDLGPDGFAIHQNPVCFALEAQVTAGKHLRAVSIQVKIKPLDPSKAKEPEKIRYELAPGEFSGEVVDRTIAITSIPLSPFNNRGSRDMVLVLAVSPRIFETD